MSDVIQKTYGLIKSYTRVLPIASFVMPLAILYLLNPESFQATWKGRTYLFFFLWAAFLELVLNWRELETNKLSKMKSWRTVLFMLLFMLPTIYVAIANFAHFNVKIVNVSKLYGVPEYWAKLIPLSMEYLIFGVLFAAINLTAYGKHGMADFSISTAFPLTVGTIYMIDNLYPYGEFTPFQIIVPTTANLAMQILNLMGYQTLYVGTMSNMPSYIAWDSKGHYSQSFAIAWPCSGIESLLIYTMTILLFLKRSSFSLMAKFIYFMIGATITYLINALRIATIYIISINGGSWQTFHDYYGQLYSISWIMSYPLIIIIGQHLVNKFRNRKDSHVAAYGVQLANSNFLSQSFFYQKRGIFKRQGCNVFGIERPVSLHVQANKRWHVFKKTQNKVSTLQRHFYMLNATLNEVCRKSLISFG